MAFLYRVGGSRERLVTLKALLRGSAFRSSAITEKREVVVQEDTLNKSMETQETKQNLWKYLGSFPSAWGKRSLVLEFLHLHG